MPIELIIDETLTVPDFVSQEFFENVLQAIADRADRADRNDTRKLKYDLCIRLCDEQMSQSLNREFRNKDKPTNVLSFAAEVDIPEINVLGDLAICWPVVVAEAKQQNKSKRAHLLHMYVHGVLHLLGFDHETDTQASKMEGLEIAILKTMNISNPYVSCN